MKPKTTNREKTKVQTKNENCREITEIEIYPKLSELFIGLEQIEHEYQNNLNSKRDVAKYREKLDTSLKPSTILSTNRKDIEHEDETVRGLSMLDLHNDTISQYSFKTLLTGNEFNNKSDKSYCRDHCDFQEWISWRTQANGQLAYLILQNSGYDVNIAPWEASREALSSNTMNSIIEHTRKSPSQETSLLGKPYIMYGIPRAHVCTKLSGDLNNVN